MLSELLDKKHVNRFPLHEVFYLVREPAEQKSYNTDEQALIVALRDGPCMLWDLKNRAGIDLYYFNSERLESEGIIMRCGLTPTDFMHIKGDYTEYDTEASELAARYLLLAMERRDTREELLALADEVYEMVEGRMFENLLRVMLMRQYPKEFKNGVDAQTVFLIREAWASRHTVDGALFRHIFSSKAALVGIGAPTHIFLPAVAKALGAPCVLPEHAEVANALGALMADIAVVSRVDISQWLSGEDGISYIAHMPSGSVRFKDIDSAIDAARVASSEAALREARNRGASGELVVDTHVDRHSTVSRQGTDVKLGCTVVSEVTVRLGL